MSFESFLEALYERHPDWKDPGKPAWAQKAPGLPVVESKAPEVKNLGKPQGNLGLGAPKALPEVPAKDFKSAAAGEDGEMVNDAIEEAD